MSAFRVAGPAKDRKGHRVRQNTKITTDDAGPNMVAEGRRASTHRRSKMARRSALVLTTYRHLMLDSEIERAEQSMPRGPSMANGSPPIRLVFRLVRDQIRGLWQVLKSNQYGGKSPEVGFPRFAFS